MHRLTNAALLGCVIICISLAAAAGETVHKMDARNNIANRLNREELSWLKQGQFSQAPVVPPKSARLPTDGAEIGILFLRGDGGDPKELRVDDSTLVYIVGRTGEGRTYQNGR